jgi:hypothetical protein
MHSRASIALLAFLLIAGVARAQGSQTFEWKLSDGGNGHWYGLIRYAGAPNCSICPPCDGCPPFECADQAAIRANSLGGHLVSVGSVAEGEFVTSRFPCMSAWCGLSRSPGSDPCVQASWAWSDGTPLTSEVWASGGNWCSNPSEYYCGMGGGEPCGGPFGLNSLGVCWYDVYGAFVEWDADCNGDGIVDYGQILRGELADLNGNGIADICELSVFGVVPVSGPSNGGTTITINGTGFPENPMVKVGGVPATNVVRHSLTRITAKTPSHPPGNVEISVESWTSPEAFYYRPECGSDLDQNGVVDGGDMAILLLDWGQCYVTVVSPQADDATPFMLQEQAAPPVAWSN